MGVLLSLKVLLINFNRAEFSTIYEWQKIDYKIEMKKNSNLGKMGSLKNKVSSTPLETQSFKICRNKFTDHFYITAIMSI